MNGRSSGIPPVRKTLLRVSALGAALVMAAACGNTKSNSDDVKALDGNHYAQVNIASNKESDKAQFTDPRFINAWGIADRPKGEGGHFWVGAGGFSFQFVGDVTKSPDAKYQKMFQDPLKLVTIPGADSIPDDDGDDSEGKTTGVVFNPAPLASDIFAVKDQPVSYDGKDEKLTGSARFIFATDSGKISGWTEQGAGGAIVRHDGPAIVEFDGTAQGMGFKGIALDPSGTKLLAADFGKDPQIRTFDKDWKLVPTTGFANPFATGDAIDPADASKGKKLKIGDPAPWNVATIGDRVFVAYAMTQPKDGDPTQLKKGEEDSLDKDKEKDAGYKAKKGQIAEFDKNGKLVRTLDADGRLNAPWAVTVAPQGFGPLSGKLLIGNFGGTGRILALDDQSGKFVDYLRDADGKPAEIEGLWGLMFGNGESLGDADALYFTAGPNEEKEGLFGSLRLK
ncbi:TIGR03118 family protein [Nocardia seriolae]|uniref:TIGR03118 family protein n=1 Tax=Nocardia seriolae TaxID=37332 RepID=UPI000A101B27|nr:TIGR03118 family protein [Nocardia seriolae]WNJ61508.1 TIGR03118 family protein [Nocardia seriolae]